MREYHLQPEKFLFLDLKGWETWFWRGEGHEFEVRFELAALPFVQQQVGREDFALFATPVVNLFKHRAEPIVLENSDAPYPVSPSALDSSHCQVYSLERVFSHLRFSTKTKTYSEDSGPSRMFAFEPRYRVTRRESVFREGLDTYLSVMEPSGMQSPHEEALHIELLCTNGSLPRNLERGDLCVAAGNSPMFAAFTNIRRVATYPPLTTGNNRLWLDFSRLNLNFSQLDAQVLRSVLRGCVVAECSNQGALVTAGKRIDGILDCQVKATDRLVGRYLRRGWEVRLTLHRDHFAGPGDMFLFCAILECFLSCYVSDKHFVRLMAVEFTQGTEHESPVRMGKRSSL